MRKKRTPISLEDHRQLGEILLNQRGEMLAMLGLLETHLPASSTQVGTLTRMLRLNEKLRLRLETLLLTWYPTADNPLQVYRCESTRLMRM